MSEAGRDARWVVPDSGVIEYWDGGDPQGRAVVFHPGTPASRVLGRWGHATAVSLSVRQVSASRPGYGGSTTTTTPPSLLATELDTAALAAFLGLHDYAVLGISGDADDTAVEALKKVRGR